MDRRRQYRFFAEVLGSCQRSDEQTRSIYISEISQRGCRLSAFDFDFKVGEVIQLSLGPVGPLNATVKWANDHAAGAEFHEMLDSALVEHFAAYCRSAA